MPAGAGRPAEGESGPARKVADYPAVIGGQLINLKWAATPIVRITAARPGTGRRGEAVLSKREKRQQDPRGCGCLTIAAATPVATTIY